MLLALGAAVAYALYLTVSAGLPAGLDIFAVTAVVCTSAAVSMVVAGLATGSLHAPGQASGWLWIGLLAVVSTVVPIAGMFVGVRDVGASAAAILSCAEPAVTVATTALVYGERLTPVQAAGVWRCWRRSPCSSCAAGRRPRPPWRYPATSPRRPPEMSTFVRRLAPSPSWRRCSLGAAVPPPRRRGFPPRRLRPPRPRRPPRHPRRCSPRRRS
ncbi:DMT family transporter [Catellatospora coxensis]